MTRDFLFLVLGGAIALLIRRKPRSSGPAVRFIFSDQEGDLRMNLTLKAGETKTLKVEALDAYGNVAPFENLVVSSSDESRVKANVATEPGETPAMVEITAVGPALPAQLSASADGIVGEGESLFAGTIDAIVTPGDAKEFRFSPV